MKMETLSLLLPFNSKMIFINYAVSYYLAFKGIFYQEKSIKIEVIKIEKMEVDQTQKRNNKGEPTIYNPFQMKFANILAKIVPSNVSHYPSDPQSFGEDLDAATNRWRAESSGVAACWINVHCLCGKYIPEVYRSHYDLHHVDGEMIVFVQWFLKEHSKIPHFGTHIGGACGVVIRNTNTELEVLLIRGTSRRDSWEFPGGAVDCEEYSCDAAVREVKEEVGLDVEVIGFAGAWDKVKSRYNCTSNYFGFIMKCKQEDCVLKLDKAEVTEARWIKITLLVGDKQKKKLEVNNNNNNNNNITAGGGRGGGSGRGGGRGERGGKGGGERRERGGKSKKYDGYFLGNTTQFFVDSVYKMWQNNCNWSPVLKRGGNGCFYLP